MVRAETLRPIPTLRSRGTIFEPIPLAVVKEENKNPERLLCEEPEFSEIKDPQIQIALRLLDTNAMANLSFDQKKTLLVYYIWHYSPEKTVKKQIIIPKKTTIHAIDSVVNQSNSLISRYERLDGMVSMVQRIEAKIKKNPPINEFDYWVFQIWSTSAEHFKNLIYHIPLEFGLTNLTINTKIKKIKLSLKKLKEYKEIDVGFKKKRQLLRQAKIVKLIENNTLPFTKELSQIMSTSGRAINHDLELLQKEGITVEKVQSEKQDLVRRIKSVIDTLETEGRSYEKGEIGPSEIASVLGMDLNYIRHFIFINRTSLGLPQKENPLLVRLVKQNKCKEKMRSLLKSNPNLSAKQILQLLRESGLEVNYIPDTIGKFKKEILAEMKEQN